MAIDSVGYYALPVIPSLKGAEKTIDRQLKGMFGTGGQKAGKQLGEGVASGLASSESKTKAAAAKHAKAIDKLADAGGKARVEIKKLNEAIEQGVKGSRLDAQTERLASALRNETTAARTARTAETELANARRTAAAAGSGIGNPLKSVEQGVSGSSGRLTGIVGGLGTKLGGAFIAGFAAVAGAGAIGSLIKSSIDTGIDFEKQVNMFSGVTASGTAGMNKMREAARALGTDTTLAGSSSADAAAAMVELAKGGMSAQEAMDAARGTLQLATAGSLDAAEAAKYQSAAMNMFSINAADAGHVADLFAASANASSADVHDLGLAMQAGGSAASGFGVSLEDTLTALTMFSQMGINGSDAGTMLKTSLLAITDQSNPAQGAIEQLNLKLYDQEHRFVGVESMMKQVAEASKNMTQEQFQAQTAILFGSDAMRGSMIAAKGGAEMWDKAATAVNREGAAAEMAAANMQGLPGVAEAMSNAWEGVKLSLFDVIDGPLMGLGNAFTDLLSHKDAIHDFFVDIGNMAITGTENFAHGIGGMLKALGDLVGGIGNVKGALDTGMEQFARLRGDNAAADAFHKSAQEAYGWGESLRAAGDKLDNINLRDLRADLDGSNQSAKNAAEQIEHVKTAVGNLPGGKQIDINAIVTFKDTSGLVISPDQLRTPAFTPAVPGEARRPRGGGRARGGIAGRTGAGLLWGPGTGTSDSILGIGRDGVPTAFVSAGEGVVRESAMRRGAGAIVAALNRLPLLAGGTAGPDVEAALAMVGTPYSQGNRTDCSGMVARVILKALGMDTGAGLMSTKTAEGWLSKLGFKSGIGGPGAMTVGWYDRGPAPNDGHMAMTLSDGENAEAGGAHGEFLVGAGAKGGDDPGFDQHMYLPIEGLYPEGEGSSAATGTVPAGSTAGTGPGGEAGYYTPGSAAKVAEAEAKVHEAEVKKGEVDADVKSKESEKLRAQRLLDEAKTKLEETKKGKFTKFKEDATKSTDATEEPENKLTEVGSIMKQFLSDTFGFGDLLPDPAELGIVKLASAIMGIKYTPQGKGFPWQTGYANGTGAPWSGSPDLGGGGLPFGMIPGVSSVLPEVGSAASGIGLGPAPGPAPNVDQSTNVTIQNPQLDEASNANLIRRTILKTPRLGTNSPPTGGFT